MSHEAFGKCIIIGEHAVVRGEPAIVFPLRSRKLTLTWKRKEGEGISVEAGAFEPAFRAALSEGLALLSQPLPAGHWHFSLASDIPPRAGMGSSAALSVALTEFFRELGLVQPPLFPFALGLENHFHGKSSGLDVAAVMESRPILFQRSVARPIEPAFKPHFFLLDTGLRSATKACVEHVISLNRPDLGHAMGKASLRAEAALLNPDGLFELAAALGEALECFRAWGLVPASVEKQIAELQAKGALAVKPTGSGNGGYLLSLWDKPQSGMIPV